MKKIYTVVFVFIAVVICSANGFSQAGTLDPAFGNAGKTFTNIIGSNSYATSTAIQADGKIVVAGYTYIGGNADFALARYNTDGSLDASFDGDGKLTTAIGSLEDIARSIAIQSDGKIVVAGNSHNGSNQDFALVRYNTNGSLDVSFDGDGKLTTAIGILNDEAFSIAIQSDGKIVVAGRSYIGTNYDFALTRYNTNGSLDITFSGDGKLTTAIGSSTDLVRSLSIQSDGKIVVAGYSSTGAVEAFALARYTTTGVLDITFSGDGKLTTTIGGINDVVNSMSIQSDGKIVVAGNCYNGANHDFALARYTTTGILDVSFSGDGILTTAIGSSRDEANSLRIQSDGKILVAGNSLIGTDFDFAFARYNVNGSLDVSFDGDGILTNTIGSSDDLAFSVAIQSDGKIVAAGYSRNSVANIDAFSLARYNTNGSLDVGFSTDGKLITAIGSSNDIPKTIAIQSDGKIIVGGMSIMGSKYDFALARYNTNGSLDLSFDVDGKLTTSIGSSTDVITSVAIQSDEKIIVGGYSFTGTRFDFALARYNSNGSLDVSFDGDGKLTTVISPAASEDGVNSIAIQSDGKIVVAGYSYFGTYSEFALARYNTNGSLDISFDGDGKLTTAIGSSHNMANSIVIQSDGKIVVVGRSRNTNDDFVVVRYNADGSLDAGFDGDGKLTTAIGSGSDAAKSLAIQSDGKIIAAGYSHNGTNTDFALARYNTDGSLDLSFDADGMLTTGIGSSSDEVNSIALQNDGKIVVAGSSSNGTFLRFGIARYNPDGSLDASFDGDGKVTLDLFTETHEFGYAMKLYSNRIYIAGDVTIEGGNDFALVSVINDAFPLPLTLLEFNGRLLNTKVVLSWKTTSELNAHSFDIERSTDGRTYTKVGNVAAFNTPGDHQYNFTDNNINLLSAPVIYYRLKQKDIDGRFTYSNIVALPIDDSKSIVLFYPNPVTTNANLTITVNKTQQVQGRIIDNAGRILKQMQWNITAGSTALPVDVKELASGTYYLELKGETINERKAFVKQ